MHLLVLSAFRLGAEECAAFGASVSMHLLVLSAFRQEVKMTTVDYLSCLNAPFGAQCFPT